MSFGDRLDAAVEEAGHPALVGIDPHLDLLPAEFALARDPHAPRAERAAQVESFCVQLLDVVAGRVAAVKPQAAFFELLGADGTRAFERVVAHARAAGLLVIGDVKRSDISSTAAAYATAFLAAPDASRCDAITVSPYLGPDTLEPFTEACRRTGGGLYVLVRTSNPGSGAFQLYGDPPLWSAVARAVVEAGEGLVGERGFSSIGAVVGATHPEELAALRAAMPRTPFLLPGYGAQGAGASDVAPAFTDRAHPWRGGLVNSSRGIAFAWRKKENEGRSWKDAASDALDAMIGDLGEALGLASR
jgi:orotidine-5'-phosphate decarboxylase